MNFAHAGGLSAITQSKTRSAARRALNGAAGTEHLRVRRHALGLHRKRIPPLVGRTDCTLYELVISKNSNFSSSDGSAALALLPSRCGPVGPENSCGRAASAPCWEHRRGHAVRERLALVARRRLVAQCQMSCSWELLPAGPPPLVLDEQQRRALAALGPRSDETSLASTARASALVQLLGV